MVAERVCGSPLGTRALLGASDTRWPPAHTRHMPLWGMVAPLVAAGGGAARSRLPRSTPKYRL
eukprot:4210382-Prymnesium_polylepis.2